MQMTRFIPRNSHAEHSYDKHHGTPGSGKRCWAMGYELEWEIWTRKNKVAEHRKNKRHPTGDWQPPDWGCGSTQAPWHNIYHQTWNGLRTFKQSYATLLNVLDCSDGCLTISEDPWPPSCTCLMYAQLWSMPALSGMAPYVKRMPYSSRGSRLRSPVASSKLRGAHPKVNYSKLSIGHHSAGGVKSQVCVCSIAFSTFNKSHWQTAYHPLPLLAIRDPRGSQGNWFFLQPGQRDTPPLSSLAHQWHGTLSPHTFKT